MTQSYDTLIVGAGFSGAVLAERLTSLKNENVLIIDKRNHIGGNAFDYFDKDGVLVHKYGPHIFHTNAKHVFDYLSQFTEWRPYRHFVKALVDNRLVTIPINLNTINELYNENFDSSSVQRWLESKAVKREFVKTSEDLVISKVGEELYEKFFKGYTYKQWGVDASELDASVAGRIPFRTNKDDGYFSDVYQVMPKHGYHVLFNNLLSHENINIMLNTDYKHIRRFIKYERLIFTGGIDSFFDNTLGKLPYRSIEFNFESFDGSDVQEAPTINYPNNYDFTRATEIRKLTGQKHHKSVVIYEYPKADGDPFYPIPQPKNRGLYAQYKKLAEALPNVFFTGRLGSYKYLNMDQAVSQSLSLVDKL